MDATTRRQSYRTRKPTAPTARAKDTKKYSRCRITNHVDLLPNVDGNSAQARRFKDLVLMLIADSGGLDMCSEIRIGLIRRLASVTVTSEWLEADLINGEPVDTATLCQLASTALRISTKLGLERVARPIPGLHDPGGLLDQHTRAPSMVEDDDAVVVESLEQHEDADDG